MVGHIDVEKDQMIMRVNIKRKKPDGASNPELAGADILEFRMNKISIASDRFVLKGQFGREDASSRREDDKI